jgi:hypoxanthine phosphoribosyltransferase
LALAKTEAKHKGFMGKINEPSRYQVVQELQYLTGRNLVIVDDVLNTGESQTGLRKALESFGLTNIHSAVLGAAEKRFTSERDMERITLRLVNATGEPFDTVSQIVRKNFSGTNKKFANEAERTIAGSPNNARRIYEYLKGIGTVSQDGTGIISTQPRSDGREPNDATQVPERDIPEIQGVATEAA